MMGLHPRRRPGRWSPVVAAIVLCVGCGDGGHGGSTPAERGMNGMIESFYGPPYTFEARLDLLRFLPRAGLDAYLYAPKNDPYHRDRWREPYPPDWMAHFEELARTGRELGVRFVFALSPGAAFDPDAGDFAAVHGKLEAMFAVGVRDFCVLFDDLSPASRGRRSGAASADRRRERSPSCAGSTPTSGSASSRTTTPARWRRCAPTPRRSAATSTSRHRPCTPPTRRSRPTSRSCGPGGGSSPAR